MTGMCHGIYIFKTMEQMAERGIERLLVSRTIKYLSEIGSSFAFVIIEASLKWAILIMKDN